MSLAFIDDLESLEPNPDQYDFVGFIKAYYEKLTDKSVLPILMNQLMKTEPQNSNEEKLTEYRMHLPVDLRRYLKILDYKCSEIPKENLQMLDGSYKTYLITFLFFCTKRNRTITDKTKLTAAALYLKLTMIPEVGKLFFNKSMYICYMSSLIDIIRSPDINPVKKESIIKLVKKHCLQEEHLDGELIAASANVIIISMISGASSEMIRYGKASGLTACSMKALRIILLHISNYTLLKIITQKLFRCTRTRYLNLIPNRELAVDIIILFLKGTFKIGAFDRKIETFIDGFEDNWASEEFDNFKDAVKIMNVFPEDHYKELLRKMITLTSPKINKTLLINVFNLIREILMMPPDFPFEKISVLYSCAASNVLHHILNTDEDIVSMAIDIFKEISDATTNPLHRYIFTEVRINHKLVSMPIESVVLGLSRAADETWTSKNKKLFEIFARFVTVTPDLSPVVVEKALDGILRDVNPKTFESSLDTLQMCFLAASERLEVRIAEILLLIIHKFAFCPNNKFSSMYARHIFASMLTPSLVAGRTYPPKYYYNIYLTTRFDYEALFIKCKDMIREQEVVLTIRNLEYDEPCSGILLCSLLEHHPYTSMNLLVPYIIDNFTDLSGHTTSGYICTALEKMLKNKPVSSMNYPELNIIQNAIMNGLFERTFPVESIRPIYSLYQVIRDILKLPEDERLNELLQHTSLRVLDKLQVKNFDNCNCFLYLNEICLLINKIPEDNFFVVLQSCLDDPTKVSEMVTFMPEVYIQTLTLLCTLAMLNKNKVLIPIKYLKQNLTNDDNVMKVLTIKLLYSLCREITHEFENVIEFSFKEMVIGNPCLVRICASILEELIHEDYIKLTSEDFFRFVYVLGSNELKVYMKSLLLNRFLLSNQNDITKYYIQTITYINMYGKFPNYPISSTFYDELSRIKPKMDASMELLEFLFLKLPINKKFNILMEISSIFEDLVRGYCKVDDSFFMVLLDLISTIKLMKTSHAEKPNPKHYYGDIVKLVEKQIIRFDPSHEGQEYYKEYEREIRRCTLALLKLLFFENDQLACKIQMALFDALVHWIDFVKEELINYVHHERGKDYDPYFAKLVQFYRKNKNMIDNFDRELRLS